MPNNHITELVIWSCKYLVKKMDNIWKCLTLFIIRLTKRNCFKIFWVVKIILTKNISILEIHIDKGSKLISLHKIVYIESFNKGSMIYVDNEENIQTKYLLKSFSKFLPEPFFFRCHNSFIINCYFIDCFSNVQVILKNNNRIPLSRHKKTRLKEILIELEQSSFIQNESEYLKW